MKLKFDFESMELDNQIVAVPIGGAYHEFRAVIKLNESASEIFELLKKETTEETIVAELRKRYPDDPEVDTFVKEFIEGLKAEGVLE